MPTSSRYESAYGAKRKLTPAQKLAELACERIADYEGAQLAVRFWVSPPWDKVFMTQFRHANGLLRLYPEEAIFRAFRAADRIRSLGAPFFKEKVDQEARLIKLESQQAAEAPAIPETSTDQAPRPGMQRGLSAREKLHE
jgi:hypothetical protein